MARHPHGVGGVPKVRARHVNNNEPLDLSKALTEFSIIKLSDTDLNGVLDKVTGLAKRTIPGAEEVSVTLMRNRKAYTAAYTGEFALRLDESQYAAGRGPCLDASIAAAILTVDDMGAEKRWPRWAAHALEVGARSSLSVGLPAQEVLTGALNMYATKPRAFDDDTIALAETFARYAAVALANAHVYDATANLAKQMRDAMESRAVIEQAKGIIMGDRHCTADEAFAILTKISQDTNHKLRYVAATLVAQAASPGG
jgi:GAF domain-containing protein